MFCNITNSVTDDGKVEMNFVEDQRFMIECIYQLIKMYFDTYKKEVEKCYQNFRKEAQAAETTSRMLGSVYNAVSCYRHVAHEIIDKYYSENAAEHKEVLLNYIKQSYKTYENIYMIADVCGANGCGSMYYVLSKDIVATRVKITVEEYIQFLQQSLDNKK